MTNLRFVLLATTALTAMQFAGSASHAQSAAPIVVAQAQSPEIKTRLRRQTDDAISRGVFGVPSMEVGDELFWGYDDFPFLELFLGGKDPLDPAEWQRWNTPVRPSSVRRRFRPKNEGT